MEEPSRVSFRDTRLASRKAEEAANRRSQAVIWLESMLGPIGLLKNPSEKEFVTFLRSGIVLCSIMNKVKPGSITKVVMNHVPASDLEVQPLPAYQYFENIRNFLVAVEELKLPSFEAADIEKVNLEAGSSAKIVDCILALKCYYEYELKKISGGCGTSWKPYKSPLLSQSKNNKTQPSNAANLSLGRKLDLSVNSGKGQCVQNDDHKSEDRLDSLVQALSDRLFDAKENIDKKLLDSWHQGSVDSSKLFSKILSSCLKDQESRSILKELCKEEHKETTNSWKSSDILKESCNSQNPVEVLEKEIVELKYLLSRTREDFSKLESQMRNDIAQLGSEMVELSSAAAGYHEAVKENRKLYNMVQDLRGNIRVFCRIRPNFNSETKSSIDYIGSDGSLIVLDPLKPQNSRRMFQFNKVFGPASSQEDVYKETQSLVRSVMDGYNVCIFAYGQTGSGKTHTMSGPANGSEKDMGINYMALNDLFKISCTRRDIRYEIKVQMVEIYNEQVRDLLCKDASTTKLEIRNCSGNGGLSLPDAAMHKVQSTSDVLDLMKMGDQHRAFSSTAMNNRSSRSHSVLTVHVHGKDISESTTNSCLHLIDLAGSERVDKSEVTGDRLKEAQHINKSLSCLGDVISALAQKNSHIPYRNSKLTLLLQNSLGGQAKMLMFAHISPEADSYGETISTLKFAQRTSTVELGAAHVNKESSKVLQLEEEVANLKKALTSRDGDKFMSAKKMERTKVKQQDIEISASVYYDPKSNNEQELEAEVRSSIETSDQVSTLSFDALCQNQQQSVEIRYSTKARAKATSELSTKLEDELMTPDTKKKWKTKKSNLSTSNSKGSHMRSTLQTIGKFINGSDKRTNQNPSEMTPPCRHGRNNDKLFIKSPLTNDARLRRRQSLASIGTSVSRRSSLSGISTDSYTTEIQNLRMKSPGTASTAKTTTTKRRM